MATFDAAVGRGLADEREARRAAGEAALARAVVGAVAPAVSVAPFTAAGRADGARAEDVRERPGDVFVICEAVAALADGVAEALGAPRVDGRGRPPPGVVAGPHFRVIGGPAHRGRGGDDAAIVRLGRRGCHAVRRGQGRGRHGRRRRFIGPPLRRFARVADLQRLRLTVRPPLEPFRGSRRGARRWGG